MKNPRFVSGSCILAMIFGTHFSSGQVTTAESSDAEPSTPRTAQADRSRGYSQYRLNSLIGFTGLLHTVAADSGAPGTFRLSYLLSTYSGSGFLCPTVAACGTRPAGVTDSQDTLKRSSHDVALSATLTSYLEASALLHAQSVSDNFASPSVMQVIGDTSFGLKAFTPRHPDQLFSVGALGQLRLLGGSGGIGIQTANIAFGPSDPTG